MVTIAEGFSGFSKQLIEDAVKNNKLLSIDVEFSRDCNFSCSYCYAGSSTYSNEISLENIKDTLKQALELGLKQVINIGGGEPLMYHSYWDLLGFERTLGLKSVTFTNGWFVNRNVAERLFNLNENIVLKFNSFDDKVQDEISGKKGSGQKIREALDNLFKAGYKNSKTSGLGIQTCVLKQNYNEIEDIYIYARENNLVPYVEILTSQGNVEKNDIQITVEQAKKLFEKLQKIDACYGIEWDCIPPIVGMKCDRMLYSAYLRADGILQPCPGVECQGDEYNILKTSVKEIVFNTSVFDDMRNVYSRLKGKCAECQHEDCYGCRGNAFQLTGDPLASDPFCWV